MNRLKEMNIGCKFELGKTMDKAPLQLLSSPQKIAVMPGFTRPTQLNLVSVPLNDGCSIRLGIAYMDEMTILEKAFASTAYEVLRSHQ